MTNSKNKTGSLRADPQVVEAFNKMLLDDGDLNGKTEVTRALRLWISIPVPLRDALRRGKKIDLESALEPIAKKLFQKLSQK